MMGMNCMVNPQMNMMPNMMMNMPRIPMTEEQKKQLRMQGYLMGKKWQKKEEKAKLLKHPQSLKINLPRQRLTVKFKKGGSVITIKMDAIEMVADILNEYFVKSNTQNGTFTYNGQNLSPMDTRLLSEAGFKNNCEIIVT